MTVRVRLEKRKVFTLLGEKLDPVHVEHIKPNLKYMGNIKQKSPSRSTNDDV